MAKWTASDFPSQAGRLAIVTGAGGLGYETALALARAGSDVIIAGRNSSKGAAAVNSILAAVPKAHVEFEELDLARLASVAEFADRIGRRHDHLELLINNAGVMYPPARQETADGFELQFGTNYLAHFALTAHLLPLLRNGKQPRVVSLSSIAARTGAIAFGDLQGMAVYSSSRAYAQSKLACLMFALELQRRSERGHWGVASMAAHPGIARTELLRNAPGQASFVSRMRSVLWFLFQPVAQGALPTLFAATSPEARPGAYYGPDRLSETRGFPSAARLPPQALDLAVAARLWSVSSELAGVSFPAEMARNADPVSQ